MALRMHNPRDNGPKEPRYDGLVHWFFENIWEPFRDLLDRIFGGGGPPAGKA